MAKDKLTDYDSTTASNNTDIGGVSIAEGMLPSNVNNSMRELTKQLGAFADGTDGVDVLKLQDDTDTNSIKLQAPSSVTANTTFTLPDGDGTADQVLKTDGSGQLGFADRHPNPSLIINGAMQIWQRTTSVTTSSSGTFSADRWASNAGASTVFSRSTDVPTGFQYSLSVAGATYTGIRTRIEAANCKHIAGQEVTFSWYAKRTAGTGDMKTYLGYASAEDNFGTVTLIEEVVNTASASVSSDWARYTYTVTLPANAANGLHFVVFNGSASGAVTTLYTGVKLEVGSTATDFIHRSYGEELALCQRYYYQAGGDGVNSFAYKGYLDASNYVAATHQHPVAMRAAPTLTKVGTFNVSGIGQPSAVEATKVTYVWQAQKDGSTGTYGFYSNNSGGFTLEAEL